MLTLLIIVLGMFPYAPVKAHAKARRIQCVNNLKLLGSAFREVSTTDANNSDYRHIGDGGPAGIGEDSIALWSRWAALSNHLATPKLLTCPADKERLPKKPFFGEAPVFSLAGLTNNRHLSYFLGIQTREQPAALGILSGDRNVTNGGVALSPGRHILPVGSKLGWSTELHQSAGNVLLGDGSVQQLTSGRLREAFEASLKAVGRTNDTWLVP